MKFYLFIFWLFFGILLVHSQEQNSDNLYRKPLKKVLEEIEIRFNIKLKYPDSLVNGLWLDYAEWRFRNDAEKTLNNVLAPFDLVIRKNGDKGYKIKKYEYHRWSVEDGKEKLDYLSGLYNTKSEWENRKKELRECMFSALKLSPLPAKPESSPVFSNYRKMDGYTIENFAIETLSGVYVCGSLYKPLKFKGKIPAVLCPNGHFENGRYNPDQQYLCATLARMGALAVSYDLFAYGESLLQFKAEDHRKSLAMSVQILNSIRIIDYVCSLEEVDTKRIGITGGSGGGSQAVYIAALDERIIVSIPVVSLSCYFYGGCPCESGMPVHFCCGGTNNPEIAAMAAPKPQLVVSDGKDWTDHFPEIEFPYLEKVYDFYGAKAFVKNVHFPLESHDFGLSKRNAVYEFLSKHLSLKEEGVDESMCTIEKEEEMYVFGKNGKRLPANAINSFDELVNLFSKSK